MFPWNEIKVTIVIDNVSRLLHLHHQAFVQRDRVASPPACCSQGSEVCRWHLLTRLARCVSCCVLHWTRNWTEFDGDGANPVIGGWLWLGRCSKCLFLPQRRGCGCWFLRIRCPVKDISENWYCEADVSFLNVTYIVLLKPLDFVVVACTDQVPESNDFPFSGKVLSQGCALILQVALRHSLFSRLGTRRFVHRAMSRISVNALLPCSNFAWSACDHVDIRKHQLAVELDKWRADDGPVPSVVAEKKKKLIWNVLCLALVFTYTSPGCLSQTEWARKYWLQQTSIVILQSSPSSGSRTPLRRSCFKIASRMTRCVSGVSNRVSTCTLVSSRGRNCMTMLEANVTSACSWTSRRKQRARSWTWTVSIPWSLLFVVSRSYLMLWKNLKTLKWY